MSTFIMKHHLIAYTTRSPRFLRRVTIERYLLAAG